eukprot:6035407-Amphidinium_carterae.1
MYQLLLGDDISLCFLKDVLGFTQQREKFLLAREELAAQNVTLAASVQSISDPVATLVMKSPTK